jgi:MHS family proline/betaine transporter-like MFS transporter
MVAGLVGAVTLIFAPEVAGRPLLGSRLSPDRSDEPGDLLETQPAD